MHQLNNITDYITLIILGTSHLSTTKGDEVVQKNIFVHAKKNINLYITGMKTIYFPTPTYSQPPPLVVLNSYCLTL